MHMIKAGYPDGGDQMRMTKSIYDRPYLDAAILSNVAGRDFFSEAEPRAACVEPCNDKVLGLIRAHPDAAVTVELAGYSLGGRDIADATPFANRFDELVEALAGRPLNWQAVR